MNQHLGATYSFSILIVVSCAVVMSRSEPSPTNHRQTSPKPTEQTSRIRDRPGVDVARVVAAKPVNKAEPLRTTIVVARSEPTGPVLRPISQTQVVARKETKAAVTTVASGESLVSVAQRVYGSIDAAAKLWKANRDQLATQSSALRAGMLLRTP